MSSKVKKFTVSTIDGVNEINKKLEKLGLDAGDVISIEYGKYAGVWVVWYRENRDLD